MPGADAPGYEIAVPSYQRARTLRVKTLAVLRRYRVPASIITIFVADDDEAAAYAQELPPKSYGRIVVAAPGICAVHNFITGYYPVGARYVSMDDDIVGFSCYDADAPRRLKPLRSLTRLIHKGFVECERCEARLWGLYPVLNGFYMYQRTTADLRFIVGTFWGCINAGPRVVRLPRTFAGKEDYLRTLLYFHADGAVARLSWVAAVTVTGRGAGGLQQPGRPQREARAARRLVAAFPNFVTLAGERKGVAQVKLRRHR